MEIFRDIEESSFPFKELNRFWTDNARWCIMQKLDLTKYDSFVNSGRWNPGDRKISDCGRSNCLTSGDYAKRPTSDIPLHEDSDSHKDHT